MRNPAVIQATRTLTVNHCSTHSGAPLASVDGLPGVMADMTPAQMRGLAYSLLCAAEDCERINAQPRKLGRNMRTYDLDAATRQEVRNVL